MRVDAKKATWTLVVWWVVVELALQYGMPRYFPSLNMYSAPIKGLVIGLVVGFVLMKTAGLTFGQALVIGLGWAGGSFAGSYAMNFLLRGLDLVTGSLGIELGGWISWFLNITPVRYSLFGLFSGLLMGLVTALVLGRAGRLGEGEGLKVTLGWMIAWGLGYLLTQLLYNFIVSSLNMTYYLFLGMHAAIGILISSIGGRVMFKNIQDA